MTLSITDLLTDDDAVSPVIGVILMVAITVILAAVIGTFVLGLGGNLGSQAPSATLNADFMGGNPSEEYADNHSVEITHDGGEELDNETIEVNIEGAGFAASNYSGASTHNAGDTIFNLSKAGSGYWNDPNRGEPASGDTIQVVWSATDSDQSTVLLEEDFPN